MFRFGCKKLYDSKHKNKTIFCARPKSTAMWTTTTRTGKEKWVELFPSFSPLKQWKVFTWIMAFLLGVMSALSSVVKCWIKSNEVRENTWLIDGTHMDTSLTLSVSGRNFSELQNSRMLRINNWNLIPFTGPPRHQQSRGINHRMYISTFWWKYQFHAMTALGGPP